METPLFPVEVVPQAETAAPGGSLTVRILRVGVGEGVEETDRVTVEAPLEFQLHHPALGGEAVSFGATMRTPGDDEALAAGLLFGEGIISRFSDIEAIESSTRRPNVVNVRLQASVPIELQATKRFSAGSSCGVCGTTGLDAAIARAALARVGGADTIALPVLLGLPARMRDAQSKFDNTGGIHAAALFDFHGGLLAIAEDVGRHNALDKLVGERLMTGELPLTDRIVLLSGRASFELVQKALRAGVSVLAAIGAPSSLAVNLAETAGLTLVGFLRGAHCNVYAHERRLSTLSKRD
jgi:FdhD protein